MNGQYHGPIGEFVEDRAYVNFTRADQESLNAQLERMYKSLVKPRNADLTEGKSVEDRKAQGVMYRSVTLLDGHYQLKLPFRQDLPDSLLTTERILKWKMHYSIASTVLWVLKSTAPKERQDRCMVTNLLTSNQSGTSVTKRSDIPGNRKTEGGVVAEIVKIKGIELL